VYYTETWMNDLFGVGIRAVASVTPVLAKEGKRGFRLGQRNLPRAKHLELLLVSPWFRRQGTSDRQFIPWQSKQLEAIRDQNVEKDIPFLL
jgi:hypothetical protein